MPSGNLYWARLNVGGATGYITENATVGATQPKFGAVSLTAKKLAGLVPISNTLLRSSSPAADLIIREDMIASLSAVEDYYLLRGDGTQNTPKGIRNWALPVNVFTAPALSGSVLGEADVASVDASLSQLELALVGAGVRMTRPGWILSPRTALALKSLRTASGARAFPEMQGGLLRGFPYATSSNVPTNLTATPQGGSQSNSCSEVILCDFSYVVLGEAEVIIATANQASYVDGVGSTISAFSQDQTVVRLILQSDIGMRRDEAIAVLTAVAY
jgi:HK97 family phage major capsid protein